jgi:hypothetical protein
MLAVEGVGEEVGEGLRSLQGGDSGEIFGWIRLGRGGVRSGCALQPSLRESPVHVSAGEPPRLRQDSFAQHTSKLRVFRGSEETWQICILYG